jgi:diguanylate cyclase (GGDEF)-like protein
VTYPPPPTIATARQLDAVNHILLIEDSEDDAELIRAELSKTHRRLAFRRVASAETMRAALAEQTWDLVISDNRMPGFDALGAYDILCHSHQETPFVVLSGALPDQATMAAMKLGAIDVVAKIDATRLLPIVERELRYSNLCRAKGEIERALVHLTYHDALTDLPNRQMLGKLVEHSLQGPVEPPARSALLFLDLCRFMRINEALGYAVGDELLRQVARRLTESLPLDAVIARPEQDKFAVYLENVAGPEECFAQARAIGEALAHPFVIAGEEIFVTCATGMCLYPDQADNARTLLRNAESAMFEAKKLGPATIHGFTSAPAGASVNQLRIETALRHAVEREELFVLYQPLFDVRKKTLLGAEALVRWRHPEFGVMPPDTFIPLADEIGLIADIGRYVLRAACRQNRIWHDLGLDWMTVAVNASATQFRLPTFVDDVAAVLAETGLAGRFLELEITETAVMHDAPSTIGTLRALKEMGVRIAIDDFGNGYSSLAYLRRFPINTLKIDKSFVLNVTNDPDSQEIVSTIIVLAKALKLDVVAEGVETIEQFEFLREHQCDRAQGWLLGRPVGAAEILALSSHIDLQPAAAA